MVRQERLPYIGGIQMSIDSRGTALAGKAVLLVDDEEPATQRLREKLAGSGLVVDCAGQRSAVREKLGERLYDLILVDCQLTGELLSSAPLLLEEICMRQPAAEVILLTGYASEQIRDRARVLGISLLLDKPQSVSTLTYVVLEHLERRQLEVMKRAGSIEPVEKSHTSIPRKDFPPLKTKIRALAVFLISCSLTFGAFSAPPGLSPEIQDALATFDSTSSEPVRIIVKLSEEPAAAYAAKQRGKGRSAVAESKRKQKDTVRNQQGQFRSQIARLGLGGKIGLSYDEALNAIALVVPSNRVADVAKLDGVVGIYHDVEVVRHDLDEEFVPEVSPELAISVGKIGAPLAWDAGFTGEGIVVAILDTGVDYRHPDLGGCFGPDCRVIGGYDFVDMDSDPMEGFTNGFPDYHGTHVAATAAGSLGVAPEAKILAVRVLGTPGGKANNLSTVLGGIEYAVANGAHVANMSLGINGVYAQSNGLWAEMIANGVEAGVVFVNSNGNNGPGYATTGVYASSPSSIGVGNADVRPIPYPRTILPSGEGLIGGSYGVAFPSSLLGTQTPVVHVGYGNSSADYAGRNVTGKFVIAERGGPGDGAFTNKANQALAAGAAAIIIYNDLARSVDFATAPLSLPSFTMSYANGQKTIAAGMITVVNFDAGPQMNASSSRGPTPDLILKPDVTGPGTAIVAAVPYSLSSTGYAALTGTSMSSPHLAGAAALVLQAHPNFTPHQVKLALMNTASNINDLTGASYRPIDQGAGMVNLARAVNPSVAVDPGSVSFGQLLPVDGFAKTRTLSISSRNGGGTYLVSASLLRSWPGVSATLDQSSVAVSGSSATVSLTVSANPSVAAAGDYEGYVTFRSASDPTDSYRVPFHFAHQLPVAEVRMSSHFVGSLANQRESVAVSFKIGRPLTAWYLGTPGGTRFTLNQAAPSAGTVNLVWNGRTSAGQILGEGHWTLGVWYQLPGSSTFTFSASYARFFVDRTAPLIGIDQVPAGLTSSDELILTGAVSDAAMKDFAEVAGNVLVNGQAAALHHRDPAKIFTAQNSELGFRSVVKLVEGANRVVIFAEDAAGNRSTTTFSYDVNRDSIAPVTTATVSPAPNVNGWNSTAVLVALAATDSSGSGVKEIRYDRDGVAVVVPGSSASVDFVTEGIHALSWGAIDLAGNAEQSSALTVRIDWTAPVVTLNGTGTFEVDQSVAMGCAASDGLSGLVADPCGQPMLTAEAWSLGVGMHERSVTATDYAGNATTSTGVAEVVVSFDSLARLSVRFANGSLGSSLSQILANAKKSSAEGNHKAANNQLSAYQSHVAAQSGKALTATHAGVLSALAEKLKR